MVFSFGSKSCIADQIDVPPIPESKSPIGLFFSIETKVKKNCSNPETSSEQF
jgi:hypothetical protein